MDAPELRIILKNCFQPEILLDLLGEEDGQGDPYQSAVDAIVAESKTGVAIMEWLDEESKLQRRKISSMPVSELRNSLSFEFLQPGRTLALIIWALMRDNRVGVRFIASQLAARFSQESCEEEETDTWLDAAQQGQADEMDENADSILQDSQQKLNALLAELDETEPDDEEALDAELAYNDLGALDEIEEDTVSSESDELSEDEVQALIASLTQDAPEDDEEPPFELELDEDDEYQPTQQQEQLESSQDSGLQQPAELRSVNDVTDDFNEFVASLSAESKWESEDFSALNPPELSIPENAETGECLSAKYQEAMIQKNENVRNSSEEQNQREKPPSDFIQLGDVEISLQSLTRACEKIFKEPVELVTDENLTSKGRIVVIGRQCGVRVLYGPDYAIESPRETPMIDPDQPVRVNPESLQFAFSRIYDEPVELVPDAHLLQEGIIILAGRKTGLSVIHQPRISIESSHPIDTPRESAVTTPDTVHAHPANGELQHLKEQIVELNNRIQTLENQKTAVSDEPRIDTVNAPAPASVPETEMEREPEVHQGTPEQMDDFNIHNEDVDDEDREEFDEDDDMLASILASAREMENQAEGLSSESADHDNTLVDTNDDADPEEIDLEDLAKKIGEVSDHDEDDEEFSLEDLNLDEELDLSDSGVGNPDRVEEESGDSDDDFDLDVMSALGDQTETPVSREVFSGERILLLGGDEKHGQEYEKLVSDLGGIGEWHPGLGDWNEDDIKQMTDHADLIMTLSSESLADPGILQAVNYASDQNKRLFEHHSASPNSIRKKLIQLVEEGKV